MGVRGSAYRASSRSWGVSGVVGDCRVGDAFCRT
jgi:hypothetical protein